jgi:hypothetical protein
MIRYSLHCDQGHAFESWFQDSAAYDRQVKRKLVACPVCNSVKVEKAIMAPQIARSRKGATPPEAVPATAPTPAPAPTEGEAATPMLMSPENELRTKLKELRDFIKKNAENVGASFPTEARKMHYGETEHRPIYGEASVDEAKSLAEEGVEVMPLPVLPEDRN